MQVGDLCIHVGVGDGTRRQNPLIDSLDVAEATYNYIKLPVYPNGYVCVHGNKRGALKRQKKSWVERVVQGTLKSLMHSSNPLCAIIGVAPKIWIKGPCQGRWIPERIWNACSGKDALNSTRLVLEKRLRHERRIRLDIRRLLLETPIRFKAIFVGWIHQLQGAVAIPSCMQLELPRGSKGVGDGWVNLYLTGFDPELIVHAANLLTHVRRNER